MKGQFIKKYERLLVGVVIALFSIAYLVGSLSIRRIKSVSIGAEFIPKIYGIVLLVLAACLIYQGINEARHFDAAKAEAGNKKDTKNVILTFILIIVYVALMEFLGFMLSSTLFLFLMSMLLTPANTKRNYTVSAVYSVALSVATYYLFHNLMYIPLPFGTIFGA